MIRFRFHTVTTTLTFFLLIFLIGSSWGNACAFATCSPALPSHACNPSHSKDIELGGRGGNVMPLFASASESDSTNCSCEDGYVAATDTYRNPSPALDSLSGFLSQGEVIKPKATLGHKDLTPVGASLLTNPVLTALRTVVLLN